MGQVFNQHHRQKEEALRSYLDGYVGRVHALPAALDLDLESPCCLTGSIARRRKLHPRPGQLQSAGDTKDG